MSDRDDRVLLANDFIEAIASRGRRFFEYVHSDKNGRQVARLMKDPLGHLYFFNEWTMKWIYVSRYGPYKGFHHGGTLHSVVSGLVQFVKTGEAYFHHSFFNARHWAYDQQGISEIITLGQKHGIIKPDEPPAPEGNDDAVKSVPSLL